MIRRPPRSPLCPYATLFRSSAIEAIYPDRLDERVELLAYHAFAAEDWDRAQCHYRRAAVRALARSAYQAALSHYRSEEHTSELQSRQYIVCRLLLEKKKNV